MTQTAILAVITAGGIALSGWLTEDKLPLWAKSLIAAGCVLVAAIVYAAITGQLTQNFTVTLAAICGIIGWLMVGPLEPVHAWMVAAWPGPLTMLFDEALKAVPPEEPATPVVPPRMTLPTTPDLVGRPSLLANDPTWRPTVSASPTPAPLQIPSIDSPATGSTASQASTGPLPAAQPGQGSNQATP